jgi:hypothetical protein
MENHSAGDAFLWCLPFSMFQPAMVGDVLRKMQIEVLFQQLFRPGLKTT